MGRPDSRTIRCSFRRENSHWHEQRASRSVVDATILAELHSSLTRFENLYLFFCPSRQPVDRVILAIACAVLLSVPRTTTARQDSNSAFSERIEPLNGLGGHVLLTNSGFGLGGYYSRILGQDVTVIVQLQIASEKDEREVAFFDRFGRKDLPNKANYLLILPVHVGIERRLFRSKIEDNFRPFIHVTIGPTVGWKYPYFRDDNDNGMLDDGEKTYDAIGSLPKGNVELGFGGMLALGAYFGRKTGITQSVRIGYSFTHFFDRIELLERTIRQPTRFFGTPTILFSFGKLF